MISLNDAHWVFCDENDMTIAVAILIVRQRVHWVIEGEDDITFVGYYS